MEQNQPKVPGILVLVALPSELNHPSFDMKDANWSMKVNLDKLSVKVQNYIDPEATMNVKVAFTSVGGDNIVSGFLNNYYKLKYEENIDVKYVINIGTSGVYTEDSNDRSKVGKIFYVSQTMEPELNYLPFNDQAGANKNEMKLPHDNIGVHDVKNELIENMSCKTICYSSNTFPFAWDHKSWLNNDSEVVKVFDQEAANLNRSIHKFNHENGTNVKFVAIKYTGNIVSEDDLHKGPKERSAEIAKEWMDDLTNSNTLNEEMREKQSIENDSVSSQGKMLNVLKETISQIVTLNGFGIKQSDRNI